MLKKIVIILAVIISAAYLIFAFGWLTTSPSELKCSGLDIVVYGDELNVMTTDHIKRQLTVKGVDPVGKPMESIVSEKIEKTLRNLSLIENCDVYKTHKGKIGIRITCKKPILHIFDKNGGEFHIDKNGAIIYNINNSIYLPVANGNIDKDLAQNELKELALFIQDNRFWREQIQQIYVTPKKEIVLVPRVGNHIIELGKIENIEKKLEKLKVFYKKGLKGVGWNKYNLINIEFDKQIICTKNN